MNLFRDTYLYYDIMFISCEEFTRPKLNFHIEILCLLTAKIKDSICIGSHSLV